jgi:hypothetical protein
MTITLEVAGRRQPSLGALQFAETPGVVAPDEWPSLELKTNGSYNHHGR